MNISYFDFGEYKKTGDDANSGLIPCVPERYDNEKLFFKLLENLPADILDASLQIDIQEDETCFVQETVLLNIIERDSDYLVINIAKSSFTPNGTMNKLIELLSLLNEREEKYGRRKEPRIKISKENFLQLGLSSIEQKIFSKTAKLIQPCAIVDVSVHGVCLITGFENPAFKNIENFHLQLLFTNPEQTAILQCHKVHSKLNRTENRVFATFSCQLLEPIHYVWKERILKMIENEDKSLFTD
ncbi:MAG: hypothetical protein IJ688_14660 [Treponema sp.]|nr:hypothetical protein [Treponema sp.]